jgi:DNA-binding CsgD family transcriptional regulator
MFRDTLVRLIYESIDEPKKRKEFLAAFAEVTDSVAAGIVLQDRRNRWAIFCATYGIDQGARDGYTNHYVGLELVSQRQLCSLALGETQKVDQVMDIREFRETEIYHGWMKPHGWLHGCWVVIHSTESEFASLFATRGPERPFEPEELAMCNALAPHLAIATRIERRIAELKDTIDRYRHGSPEIETLATLNLSPAETRTALALFKGQTAAEYARLSGLSMSTVKWYAQKVYQKAGVRRQTDLIRLLIERFRS